MSIVVEYVTVTVEGMGTPIIASSIFSDKYSLILLGVTNSKLMWLYQLRYKAIELLLITGSRIAYQ